MLSFDLYLYYKSIMIDVLSYGRQFTFYIY